MKFVKYAVIFVGVLLLLSCASMNKPSPEEISAADHGTYPADHINIVKNYIKKGLYDPYKTLNKIFAC